MTRPRNATMRFDRYLGIDYSGAATPEARLAGLRLYEARPRRTFEIHPPNGRRLWSRRALTEWLAHVLAGSDRVLVGVDHCFSLPLRYFDEHQLERKWSSFLDDFAAHWPTDRSGVTVNEVRNGHYGRGRERWGRSTWRRRVDIAAKAKSPFHFDVPGSVAKSTHAGLPLLRELSRVTPRPHFWPFDGWLPRSGRSVVAEAYPRLVSSKFPRRQRTADQHDAYCIARSLRQSDEAGELPALFAPQLPRELRAAARVEGWILGLPQQD